VKHRRLFDLRVRHAFHEGGVCPDVRVEPRTRLPDGARALARHRLHAVPRPDGLEIVAEVGDDDTPLIDPTGLQIGFDVRVTGPDFAHYTDPSTWKNFPRPTYRGSSPAGGTLSLASGPEGHPPDVAAAVEIAGVAPGWLAAPPRFYLDLPAREALWVYYLVTTRPNGHPPEIKDGEPARNLAFTRTLLSPAETAGDPVGAGLLARHPDRRCFRMISERPVACRRAPLRQLALYLGDELLLRELSNPPISSHATLRVEPQEQPRPSLFRVIEY
jgi:hypothetical protein